MHVMGGLCWRRWVLGRVYKWVETREHRSLNHHLSCVGSLPELFQTPMFWNDEDLEGLRGTNIFGEGNTVSIVCFLLPTLL